MNILTFFALLVFSLNLFSYQCDEGTRSNVTEYPWTDELVEAKKRCGGYGLFTGSGVCNSYQKGIFCDDYGEPNRRVVTCIKAMTSCGCSCTGSYSGCYDSTGTQEKNLADYCSTTQVTCYQKNTPQYSDCPANHCLSGAVTKMGAKQCIDLVLTKDADADKWTNKKKICVNVKLLIAETATFKTSKFDIYLPEGQTTLSNFNGEAFQSFSSKLLTTFTASKPLVKDVINNICTDFNDSRMFDKAPIKIIYTANIINTSTNEEITKDITFFHYLAQKSSITMNNYILAGQPKDYKRANENGPIPSSFKIGTESFITIVPGTGSGSGVLMNNNGTIFELMRFAP